MQVFFSLFLHFVLFALFSFRQKEKNSNLSKKDILPQDNVLLFQVSSPELSIPFTEEFTGKLSAIPLLLKPCLQNRTAPSSLSQSP